MLIWNTGKWNTCSQYFKGFKESQQVLVTSFITVGFCLFKFLKAEFLTQLINLNFDSIQYKFTHLFLQKHSGNSINNMHINSSIYSL